MFSNGWAFTPLLLLSVVLALGAFVTEVWAFVDAIRRPSGAFTAAGKLTRPLWLIILGVSSVVGLGTVVSTLGGSGIFALVSILPIAAFVAAAVYLTDVRPRVSDFRRGTSSGPYGPW